MDTAQSLDVVKRFVRYCKIDTQRFFLLAFAFAFTFFYSSFESETYPTTNKQFNLANLLVNELKDLGMNYFVSFLSILFCSLGLNDASVDQHCIVTATIPTNCGDPTVMGLLAHMDVSPDAPCMFYLLFCFPFLPLSSQSFSLRERDFHWQ
jgi:tripeptide aminopeptidase